MTEQTSDKQQRHTLLLNLRDKIERVGKAYDLEYDGDKGPRVKEVSDAGIDLDDFVMVHAEELTSLLDALLEVAPRPSLAAHHLCDKLDELIEGIDHMGTGSAETEARSEREWKSLAAQIRASLPPTPARRECEHGNAYNECNRCNTSFQPTPASGETPQTDPEQRSSSISTRTTDLRGRSAASGETQTPRTDAVITGGTIGQMVIIEHARQLERELHEAGDGDTWREACHRTERELRKLQMEMPDYKQCCELREKAERELAEAQSATVPSKRESIVTTLGDDSILYLQPMLFDEGDRVEVTITLAPTDDRGAG